MCTYLPTYNFSPLSLNDTLTETIMRIMASINQKHARKQYTYVDVIRDTYMKPYIMKLANYLQINIHITTFINENTNSFLMYVPHIQKLITEIGWMVTVFTKNDKETVGTENRKQANHTIRLYGLVILAYESWWYFQTEFVQIYDTVVF